MTRTLFMLGILVLLSPGVATAQTSVGEAEIKAVFLYNFTIFVEWPDSAFENEDSPFVIAVPEGDPIRPFLEIAVEGERYGDRLILVQGYHLDAPLPTCQILYLQTNDARHRQRILESLGTLPLLTVSDADSFARDGGMIGFSTVRGRVQLTINLGATKRAGLRLSSKLLSLARTIPE